MKVQRILWPTDFSENAAKALPYVQSLSEKYQTEVHVLYVLKDYGEWGASYGDYQPEDVEKMRQWEKEMAEKRLDELCEKFLDSCPLYIRHVAVGDPVQEILKIIDKENVDLVVMASRGSEGHFDVGSVTQKLLQCSTIPIVTIPVISET
ncbi:MAG: universal stress protein [Deltaproteobacteria bacterium]|nr:MAG: universal stress protein [Deltaproteobacteria bacterium]